MIDASISMFEGSGSDLTNDQMSIIRYCRFYNHYFFSVSEKERPPRDLIEYDRLFDDWIERREAKKKFAENRPSSSRGRGFVPVEEMQEQYRGK